MKIKLLKIFIAIGSFFLNALYGLMKIRKTKKQVVLLSRQSDVESLDFKLLREALEADNIEVVKLYKMIHEGLINKIKYAFYMLKIMNNLSISSVCVIDGYSIPISLLKHKKDLTIIQMWHASGATKKFGFQALDTKEGSNGEIAKIMHMHKNYDYVLAPSKATGSFFAEAFNTSTDKIKIIGLPRIEYLKKEDKTLKEKLLSEYPNLKNKRIILYVPTFRKNKRIDVSELINNLDQNNYSLIIRVHPLDEENVPEENKIDSKYNTNDLLKIADFIITDYSAIAYEAIVTGKPIYFYVYDIDEYMQIRGLNVNLESEMKSSTYRNAKDLLDSIENKEYDFEELEKFKNKYITIINENNIEKFKSLIIDSL